MNDIIKTYYNKDVTIDFLNTYLNPLGFSINIVESNGINLIDVVDKNQHTVICSHDNYAIYMYFYWNETNKILLELCNEIIRFRLSDNSVISNPYYGCKSIEEMNVKRDLIVS